MVEDIKSKIREFLKRNRGKKFSLKELSRKTKISYPSVLKWSSVLIAEGNEVKLEDHGHIKFIYVENDKFYGGKTGHRKFIEDKDGK